LLAAAGLDRLGRDVGSPISVETMLPAPSQGAVGIETRRDDDAVREWLAVIDHADTSICVRAERALLARLGGDCRSPVAALAVREGRRLRLRAQILSPDGARAEAGEAVIGDPGEAADLAAQLLDRAAPELRAHFSG
jgi:hydroxymethylbilane synthase